MKGKHYGCQRRPENQGCGRVSISQQGLDAYVVEEVLSFLSAVELRPTPGDLDPDALRRAVEEDDKRLKDLNRARFVLGTISQEEWQPARDELSARLDAGREALAAWERQQDGLLRPGSREDLDAWWEAATVEQRRGAMGHTLVRIKITPASRRGPLFDTDRVELFWNWKIWMRASKQVGDIDATPQWAIGWDEMADDERNAVVLRQAQRSRAGC